MDTPNLAFNLQRTGEYRIDVDSAGNVTNVSVMSGRGEVTGGGYSYTVVAGQSARFSGTDQLSYDIAICPLPMILITGRSSATIVRTAPNPPTMFRPR